MEIAVLQIDERSFTLTSGVYLIRGFAKEKPIEEHHTLHIENESVDDKHAMIVAEANSLFVYDLNTRFGTFVNEQRLPVLTKFAVPSDGVCIRFGEVEGRLNRSSILEQHHSSGFHEESIHLALDHTSDAENLTIPETQFVVPENTSSIKNISKNNISIPETQEILEPPTKTCLTNTNQPEIIEPHETANEDKESQFCISTQEFNACLNDTTDSNSRDFLENINWLVGDENTTSIKQTDPTITITKNKDNENNPGFLELQIEPKSTTLEEMVPGEEELRSSTPDLFNVDFLDEFEKKEARIINARANRAQNENPSTEDTGALKTKDDHSEERTQTASAKSSKPQSPNIMEKNISTATTSPPTDIKNNEAIEKSAMEQHSKSTEKTNPSSNQIEVDLFEGEVLENEPQENGVCSGTPLQHSNKENMLMQDLEPTEVFVNKQAMKPPAVLPPINANSLPTGSLLPSDLEPTQVYVPKKKKEANTIKQFVARQIASPKDDKDLVPTQKFVPKKSSKNVNKPALNLEKKAESLNSTMVPTAQNGAHESSLRSFFAKVESGLDQDEQPSGSVKTPKSAKGASIMLTPEFLSHTFAKQKPPDSASRRNLLSLLDNDSESEDTLTRLLTQKRRKGDFDGLMDSIKKTEDSSNNELTNSKETDDLLNKYILKKNDISPKKLEEVEKIQMNLKKSSSSVAISSSSRSLRNKRNTSEEPVTETKRIKTAENSSKNISANEKRSSERANRRLKRSATVDEAAIVISNKTTKIKTNSIDGDGSNASVSSKAHTGRTTRNSKPVPDIVEESNKTVTNTKKGLLTTNSSSGSAVTKASSSDNTESRSEESKKRGKKPSNSSSVNSVLNVPRKSERNEEAIKTENISKPPSANTVKLMQASESKSQPKRDVKSKITRQEKVDISLDAGAHAETKPETNVPSTEPSEKKTRGRQRKNTAIKKEIDVKPKNVENNSSIIEVQGKRTRSRTQSTIVTSQGTSNKTDTLNEMPSASKTAKKQLTKQDSNIPEKSVLKVAFTMVEPQKREELMKHTKNKWIEAKDPTECEVLVMDTANRTVKFLIALAKGIPIVTSEWLEAIKATGFISVRSNYFFKDAAFEKTFQFSLLHTLNEAKKAKLFTNYEFLLTKNLLPTPNDMKIIVTSAGGTVLENGNVPKEQENQQLYLISSEKDRQHWHSYRRKNPNICITSTETVMLAVMRYDRKLLKKRSF